MSKTLYVTDLDGTLLSTDATLSEANARKIASLTARGALITCATARTPGTVQPLMGPAHLSAPAIVMTGAAMWTIDGPDPHFEDVHAIPDTDLYAIDELFAKDRLTPFIYCVRDEGGAPLHFYHRGKCMSDDENRFADMRSRLAMKRFHPCSTAPREGRVLYFAMGKEEVICHVAEGIRSVSQCALSCYPDNYTRGLYLLEVFAPGVSKASAVKRLARRTGCERTVVFGDNLNDLPMLGAATVSVAAPGALAEVKAKADITLEPGETPVADFIEKDYLC